MKGALTDLHHCHGTVTEDYLYFHELRDDGQLTVICCRIYDGAF